MEQSCVRKQGRAKHPAQRWKISPRKLGVKRSSWVKGGHNKDAAGGTGKQCESIPEGQAPSQVHYHPTAVIYCHVWSRIYNQQWNRLPQLIDRLVTGVLLSECWTKVKAVVRGHFSQSGHKEEVFQIQSHHRSVHSNPSRFCIYVLCITFSPWNITVRFWILPQPRFSWRLFQGSFPTTKQSFSFRTGQVYQSSCLSSTLCWPANRAEQCTSLKSRRVVWFTTEQQKEETPSLTSGKATSQARNTTEEKKLEHKMGCKFRKRINFIWKMNAGTSWVLFQMCTSAKSRGPWAGQPHLQLGVFTNLTNEPLLPPLGHQ